MGGQWSFEDLDKFLLKPRDVVSGTKMTFAGLKKPEDRAALLMYLRSMSDAPMAMP
jgi:cytochrome c